MPATATDAAFLALEAAAGADQGRTILEFFEAEPDRLSRLCVEGGGLRIDLSKQAWSAAALDAALALAEAADVEHARARPRLRRHHKEAGQRSCGVGGAPRCWHRRG